MPCVPAERPDLFTVRTRERADAIDITARVELLVEQSGISDGLCQVFIPHTTAGVFVNENADKDVCSDLFSSLERLVPWQGGYRHAEGNAAAHIKSILTGSSALLPVRAGRLALGRWQGVFLVEFDGPRERQVRVTLVPAQK
jgi:secondary thiamine-phosphate synthase enzyme